MKSLLLAVSLVGSCVVTNAQDGIMRNLLLRGPNSVATHIATITVPVLTGPTSYTLPPNGGELLISAPTTNGQLNNLDLQGTLTLNGLTGPGVLTLNASEQVVNVAGTNGQLLQWVGGVPTFQDVAAVLGGTPWVLAGNTIADASTQFIGTTSNHPLVLRANNVERLRLNTNGGIQRDAGGDARGTNAIDLQSSRVDVTHVASGPASVIGGGSNNRASGGWTVVGGGNRNSAEAQNATIGGGLDNRAEGTFSSTVGGGGDNWATASFATISGGGSNRASAFGSAIGGGDDNQTSGARAAIPGGRGLRARSFAEVVAGVFNTDYSPSSTTAFDAADRLFVLGNGTTDAARADALVVYKNGAVAFGSAGSTGLAGHILVSQGASAPPQWQLVETALGGTTVLYGVSGPQSTVGDGSRHLFNVEYSSTIDEAAVGARINSVTTPGSAPNQNARGLSIRAETNGTGSATALSLSAVGGVNRALEVTNGIVYTDPGAPIEAFGAVNTNSFLNVNNREVHTRGTIDADIGYGTTGVAEFGRRYYLLNLVNLTAAPATFTFPAGENGQRLTLKVTYTMNAGASVTFLNTRTDETGADAVAGAGQDGQHVMTDWIYDTDTNEWVLLSSVRIR